MTSEVTRGSAEFARDLHRVLSKTEENILFSPLSLHCILSLIHHGAEGKTAKTLKKALHIASITDLNGEYKDLIKTVTNSKNITFDMANKIYYTKIGCELKETFESTAKEIFLTEIERVDFRENEETTKKINDWVEENTHSKINNLIQTSDFNNLTNIILINATYFKGNWETPFDRNKTRKETFYLNEEEEIKVEMMYRTSEFYYAYNSDIEAEIVEVPFKNPLFSMIVILPCKRNGLHVMEEKLAGKDILAISRKLKQRRIIFGLPRFKIEATMNLAEPLKKLGLESIFTEIGDFSGIVDSEKPFKLEKIIQKVYLDVNEEGAEAAAVTGPFFRFVSKPREVIANHPFVFLIKQKSCILFQGRLLNPNI